MLAGSLRYVRERERKRERESITVDVVVVLHTFTTHIFLTFLHQVTLKFPPHLWHLFSEFPPLPARRTTNPEEWSEYMTKSAVEHSQKADRERQVKLVGALDDLVNYPIHCRQLALVLSLGVEMVALHKAIKFSQSYWLKFYVQQNQMLRQQSNDPFTKNFFKL